MRDNDPGDVLIRGAAGSGKTTTALLRLELVSRYWISRRDAEDSHEPIRVLALAFNRTLVGYIKDLAAEQLPAHRLIDLEVETVAGFNRNVVGFNGDVWGGYDRADRIWSLGRHLGLSRQFLLDEVEYILGRFPPDRLGEYLTSASPRLGRGRTPALSAAQRQRIHDDVVAPFNAFKRDHGLVDWNDLAVLAAAATPAPQSLRQVVVIDEAQDFSVNQMRSVVTHLDPDHSLTVVTDTAQRIYPRYLYYPEAGVAGFDRIYSLSRNFRNTPAIAAVAASILVGLTLDEDATIPTPVSAGSEPGEKPHLLSGDYSQQLAWTVERLRAVDLTKQTAAVLTLRGGGYLNFTRDRLSQAGLDVVDLQRKKDWPVGDSNLAVSTLHSAKGLEFDHVFILGLNSDLTQNDGGEDDASLDLWRRLLGMAVGRARISATMGYKPEEASDLVEFIDRSLVTEVNVGKSSR